MARSKYQSGKRPIAGHRLKKPWWIVGIVVAVLLCLVLALELTNTTYLFHKRKAVSGTIPSQSPTSTAVPHSSTKTQANTDSTPPVASQKTDTPSSTTTAPLIAPYGTFVSNHHPNLGGSPAPSQEQSVCLTTPGATCGITFQMDGVTKTLEVKTADGNGAVYWNWDVKTAGFTEGSWQITVTAKSSIDTKSTDDSQKLVVGP